RWSRRSATSPSRWSSATSASRTWARRCRATAGCSTGSTPCCSCCRRCGTWPGSATSSSCEAAAAGRPAAGPERGAGYPGRVAVTTVAIAGSTGSIGTQTIDVVRAEPERFEVVALGAWSSADALLAQARDLRPKLVVVGDTSAADRVVAGVPAVTVVQAGSAQLAEMCTAAEVLVNGVVCFDGLNT